MYNLDMPIKVDRNYIKLLTSFLIFCMALSLSFIITSTQAGEPEYKPSLIQDINQSKNDDPATAEQSQITPKNENPPLQKNPVIDKELSTLIKDWADSEPGEFAIVVQEIDNDMRRAEYNPTDDFISASTYKLFVSYILLQEIERKNLTYNSMTSIGKTLDECFDSLLTYSWDVCAYPMGQLIGWDELQNRLVTDGYLNTNINNYDANGNFNGDKHTTAEDEALFMERLATGELLAKNESEYLITILKNQKWRERIPAGVPENVKVADKPGWLYGYQNDTAIVYGEDVTYVLVILSNNSSTDRLADISTKIYSYFHPKIQ